MEVVWTTNALEALAAIHAYIAEDSPSRADRIVESLVRRSDQIAVHPESGRMVPGFDRPDLRELIDGRYRIIFQVGPSQIHVIAVVHVRRELPWEHLPRFR